MIELLIARLFPFFLLFNNLLKNILTKITLLDTAAAVWLSPAEVASIKPTELIALEQEGLISKCEPPKLGWCYSCNTYSDINDSQQSFCCFNCASEQPLKQGNNYVEYFASLDLLVTFLQTKLKLAPKTKEQESSLVGGRLVYLGQQEELSYYLLLDIQLFNNSKENSGKKISNIIKHCYIFSLQESHNIKPPKSAKLYNLLDCLELVEGKLLFSTPTFFIRRRIGQIGGAISSNKRFGEAREFVWQLFQQKRTIEGHKKTEKIYEEILAELIKRPDLTRNLSEDNLFYWLAKQIRAFQRKIKKNNKQKSQLRE